MQTNSSTLTVEQLKSIGFEEVKRLEGKWTAMRFRDITVVLRPLYGLDESGSVLGWVSYSADFKYSISGHDFSTLESAVHSMYSEALNIGHILGRQEKAKEIRDALMM